MNLIRTIVRPSIRNLEIAEVLRDYVSSNPQTNLFILIILAGDNEMNPGPKFQCGLCKK